MPKAHDVAGVSQEPEAPEVLSLLSQFWKPLLWNKLPAALPKAPMPAMSEPYSSRLAPMRAFISPWPVAEADASEEAACAGMPLPMLTASVMRELPVSITLSRAAF
ncbi:hypothetical protein D3C87_1465510 [compost metagenome]